MIDYSNIPLQDHGAPVVYASAATGVYLAQGNLHVTFEVLKQMPDPGGQVVERHVVQRMVMPLESAAAMATMIQGFIAKMTAAASLAPPAGSAPN